MSEEAIEATHDSPEAAADELTEGQLNWLLDDPEGEAMLDQALDEMFAEE
jgi:hypothetical protein